MNTRLYYACPHRLCQVAANPVRRRSYDGLQVHLKRPFETRGVERFPPNCCSWSLHGLGQVVAHTRLCHDKPWMLGVSLYLLPQSPDVDTQAVERSRVVLIPGGLRQVGTGHGTPLSAPLAGPRAWWPPSTDAPGAARTSGSASGQGNSEPPASGERPCCISIIANPIETQSVPRPGRQQGQTALGEAQSDERSQGYRTCC